MALWLAPPLSCSSRHGAPRIAELRGRLTHERAMGRLLDSIDSSMFYERRLVLRVSLKSSCRRSAGSSPKGASLFHRLGPVSSR